ncbi:MAG: FAD-binding protein [Geminicoccaceae bacterium]|nr:FAD-binding protein [Geminicoccaceae bacterium]MCS7266775.1 FAD-binding protein [Geminicoccaceae bacterium]MCX7630514.1 FAD-binding protein [Geminicoccaceae bacterium]MDW8123796.1 FAD-binding protein [Geminicoccaceae bacterium]MDW8341606.1 FAD-binding protein [Geminicoccaceae bacterium]
MTALVLAQHDGRTLEKPTLHTVAAATRLPGPVHVLVAGHEAHAVAETASRIDGVARVLLAEHRAYAHPLAEDLAALLVSLAEGYDFLLAPATTFGKNVMPRAAALLDVAQVSDVVEILAPDTFKRYVYAGNALATVQSLDAKRVLTIRTTAFPAAGQGGSAEIVPVPAPEPTDLASFVGRETAKRERPELSSARIVVSGGRGLGSAENFKLVEELADVLGAAVGASRAAVDAGFVPNEYQVGQTGKIVAPELYIAVGISGAIQHLAGMKDSKVIVAINKDEEAPIFQVADYGLVGDLFKILPELTAELRRLRGERSA